VITERRALQEIYSAVAVMTGPSKAVGEVWPYKFEKPVSPERSISTSQDQTKTPYSFGYCRNCRKKITMKRLDH
jgi:hypothetical protein